MSESPTLTPQPLTLEPRTPQEPRPLEPVTLDEAWTATEAALGEWWRIRSLAEVGLEWEAVATDGRRIRHAVGPTPLGALNALNPAAALREAARSL